MEFALGSGPEVHRGQLAVGKESGTSVSSCGLVFVEVGLLESFLPYEWRNAIHQQTERVFPSAKYDPHPEMDWEFQLDFRQHPAHRVVMFGIVGVLMSGVAYLLMKTWRKLRQVG
jgi:hypothetical protein